VAATEAKRQSNRWQALLDSAAAKFAELGYHGATIRELAAAAAMTPGAIYFHVPNKQALLLAVYEEGVQRILDRIDAAVRERKAAWDRLEAAVAAHLESILDASAYARVIIRILPGDVPEVAAELTKMRDRYEARFRALFAEIDLPPDRDPKLARLFVLGAINWTPVWYRPRGLSIPELARELLAPLRALAESRPARRK
jgi:TetR/AcrR family transcriptional regulator, cholesterol catabolism regulator